MSTTKKSVRYLIASDFDQTLSFNDSGHVLGEIVGIKDLSARLKGFPRPIWCNRVLNWPISCGTDPEFRGVRREHLVDAGKPVRLKENVKLLAEILAG